MTERPAQIGAAALVFLGFLLILAGGDRFAFDPDEGGSVAKALLVAQGHAL